MNNEKITGYPSIDKPWLKYYSKKAIYTAQNPIKCSLYQYILMKNKIPLRVALEYFNNKITYKELFQKIDRLANCFEKFGIQSGDYVTICLPNVPELIYTIYALNKIGAIANIIDPRVNSKKILELTNLVQSKLFIVIRDICEERISCISDRITASKILVVSASDSAKSIKVYLKYHKKFDCSKSEKYMLFYNFIKFFENKKQTKNCYIENTTAAIVYTSGTTGTAKGVMLSNEAIIAASEQLLCTFTSNKAKKFLAIIPFAFSYGLVDGMNTMLGNGMTVTLIPQYHPNDFTSLLLKYKPNVVISVPKFWEDMAYKLQKKETDLSFMIYPISGGDKITDTSVEKINMCFKEHNAKTRLVIGYGATEFGAAVSFTTPDGPYEAGSVGEPMPTGIIKIINPETGEELPYNEDGEILIRTQTMMLGYYQNKPETESVTYIDDLGNKYYRSGDKGHISSNGALFIVDRYKRVMMRPDGHTVHASPIENTIMKIDKVHSCAVVGLRLNGRVGVIPTAYIIPEKNVSDITKLVNEIDEYCLTQLPDRDRATAYIIVDKFPYTMNGKIDFKQLEIPFINETKAIITDFTFINKYGETKI